MTAAMTLFRLHGDDQGLFDGSVNGITIAKGINARVLGKEAGIALANGMVDIARHRDLDELEAFTIDATVTPTQVGTARQNIAESQTPSVALFIEANGQLVGSVAWVFKRSDLYVFEPNELEYGLSQPDAAGRGVDSAGIRRLIQANAGKRDVLIITRVKDNARAAAVVPPDTRHAQQGALAAWYITAAKPDPDAQSMTSTLAPRM